MGLVTFKRFVRKRETLFGPLAPLALVAALAALVVLMALLAGEYTVSAMRRGSDAVSPQRPTPASPQPSTTASPKPPTRISDAA